MSRLLRSVTLVLVVAVASACDSSSGPPDDGAFIGTYALITVNGAAVPLAIPTGDGPIEIVSGQLVFNADSTCAGAIVIRESGATGTETMSNTCTWTRAGSQVTVSWSDGGTDIASVSGSNVTLIASDLGGLILVFRK
jgi:hypothetical protein